MIPAVAVPTEIVETVVADERWAEALADLPDLVAACVGALAAESGVGLREAAVLFTDDETMRDLNARFRGRDKATNVLSFPSGEAGGRLGDVALGFETCVREAAEAGLSLRDRAAHMLVHGLAHLMGFDHEDDADAARMERFEAAALARLGVDDPYAGGGDD